MDAVNGVHLHHLIQGTFVPNLNGQRIDFTDIIFDCRYDFAFVYLVKSRFLMNHYELSNDVLTRLMIMPNQV
jgi:hypothetical protein